MAVVINLKIDGWFFPRANIVTKKLDNLTKALPHVTEFI